MSVTHPLKDYVLEGADFSKQDVTLEEFKMDLTAQLAKAFPTQRRPYTTVNVLLLSWVDADSNNANDVALFQKFLEKDFNYHCTAYQIVSLSTSKPDLKGLRAKLLALEEQSTNDSLSIIYYNGHAYSNAGHNPPAKKPLDCVLFPRADVATNLPGGFDVETTKFGVNYRFIYSAIAAISGDVLHILECCAGGGAAIDGEHEILAASTFDQKGKRDAMYSPSGYFTSALIESMGALHNELGVFTTAQLVSRMQGQGRYLQPPLRTQPVFIPRAASSSSITLTRLVPHLMPTVPPLAFDKRTDKALISVSFEKDVEIVAGDISKWLTSKDRPEYVQDVKMVAYIGGRSSTVLVTMPFAAWTVLESNPAYKLLDFISSDNFMLANE